MGDLKKNISWKEIACQCGCGMGEKKYWNPTIDKEHINFSILQLANDIQRLADILSLIYQEAKIRIKFTSWCRCPSHNAKTPGAAKNSLHKTGGATDNKWQRLDNDRWMEIPPSTVVRIALKLTQAKITNFGGIGCYHNRVHFDIRSGDTVTWVKDGSGYRYGVDFTEL